MLNPIILDVECIVCNKKLQTINHNPREISIEMGKIINRRARTPNWSLEEKQYLLDLIKEHRSVVISKSNNGPNHSEEKEVVWNEILTKLAKRFGSKFCAIKKVKTQWQNMKRIAREEVSFNGAELEKYTKLSLEVCNILELVKDGVFKDESENFNETTMSTNIEIKAECIDEYLSQPSCSYESLEDTNNETHNLDSSSSSVVEPMSEDNDTEKMIIIDEPTHMKDVAVMTDISYLNDITNITLFRKDMEEYIRRTEIEKQIKLDSLKEERQVVRAMRETAELNKIIAEQKLKHVLWVKKQEVAKNKSNNFDFDDSNVNLENVVVTRYTYDIY